MEDAVMRSLAKERQSPGRAVLFPIRPDEAVLTAPQPWSGRIRMQRHIGDFWAGEHDGPIKPPSPGGSRDLKAQSG